MRLINVRSMKMEEFFGDSIPSYVILSHTWTAQEISFQDYMWLQNYDEEVEEGVIEELPSKQRARVVAKAAELRRRSGHSKILNFTRLAKERLSFRQPESFPSTTYKPTVYVWVDTCCINKESSAELSEAINSMFKWYKDSNHCVAFLSDVSGPGEIAKGRWFTRGWTLQELRPRPNR